MINIYNRRTKIYEIERNKEWLNSLYVFLRQVLSWCD